MRIILKAEDKKEYFPVELEITGFNDMNNSVIFRVNKDCSTNIKTGNNECDFLLSLKELKAAIKVFEEIKEDNSFDKYKK